MEVTTTKRKEFWATYLRSLPQEAGLVATIITMGINTPILRCQINPVQMQSFAVSVTLKSR